MGVHSERAAGYVWTESDWDLSASESFLPYHYSKVGSSPSSALEAPPQNCIKFGHAEADVIMCTWMPFCLMVAPSVQRLLRMQVMAERRAIEICEGQSRWSLVRILPGLVQGPPLGARRKPS